MIEQTEMETPLEILSRAAQMVDNAQTLKLALKKGKAAAAAARQQKRNSGKIA
jgi:hypothetical protein